MSGFLHKMQDRLQDEVQKRLGSEEGQRGGGAHPDWHHGQCPPFPIDRPDDPVPVVPQPGHRASYEYLIDNTPLKSPGPGKLPPKVASKDYHKQRHQFYHPSGKPHQTMRDLGFTGVLDGKIIWGWGDVLMGDEKKANICAVDAASIGCMKAPMHSMDTKLIPGTPFVQTFLPLNDDEEKHGGLTEWTLGCSNVIELSPNNGVVFYHKIHRPGGHNKFLGSGVATCKIGKGSVPEAKRPYDIMWGQDEPKWGDTGASLEGKDGHIYIWGHGPDGPGDFSSHTYLMRCPKDHALDIHKYEYWHHKEKRWMKERIGKPEHGKVQITKEMAQWGWFAMNQSRPFWNNYFNCWMFIHSSGWPVSDVLCKTADKLEGPWKDHGMVASTLPEHIPDVGGNGWRYCVNGHPWFDPSGKTVLATWTRDNIIWGVTIEWE